MGKGQNAKFEHNIVASLKESDVKNMQNVPTLSKIQLFLTNITVEPIMVCIVLPSIMVLLISQNLYLEKSCRVNLALDQDICDALTARNDSFPDYKIHEATVQIYAANMTIWKNILQSLFTATLLFFLGSWSDRHQKRKTCIINSVLGEIFNCTTDLLGTYFFYELPLQILLFGEALPTIYSGGWHSMFLGVYSYISTITPEETRTMRIGAVHTIYGISFCIGVSLSGVLFQNFGFYGVYGLALSIFLTGFIYGTYFVKDIWELQPDSNQEIVKEKKKNFFLDFYDFKHAAKTLRIVFKKGDGSRRTKICLILILGILVLGPLAGEINVAYFYVRYKYGWDSVQFSIFFTFQYTVCTIGAVLALAFFSKFLKWDDAVLGMISATSKICGCLIYAFAPNTVFFYLGAVAEMFNTISFISMRSIISKFIPLEELGAVNSIVGCVEAFLPLVWAPVYSKTYAATLDNFPGAFYLLGIGISVPTFCIFLWLYVDNRKNQSERKALKSQTEALMENYSELNATNNSNHPKRISILKIQNDFQDTT